MKNGKAVYIPYDNDRCLGMTTSGKDMTTFSPYADNTALQGSQENPVFKYSVITRNNLYTTEYTNALKAIAESGWLDYSKYKKIYNVAKANYASVAIPDSNVKAYVRKRMALKRHIRIQTLRSMRTTDSIHQSRHI